MSQLWVRIDLDFVIMTWIHHINKHLVILADLYLICGIAPLVDNKLLMLTQIILLAQCIVVLF